ncbi:MAG: hypothetical protein MUO63_01660 [Desulfobulbaceae bacterium]|nr:hypothetical protein [Desulfobulbaceae bacterium]
MKIGILLVAMVLVSLAALRLACLHFSVNNPQINVSGPREDELFFKELLDSGLIHPVGVAGVDSAWQSQRLEAASSDAVYSIRLQLQAASDSALKEALALQESLITRLYREEVGRAVRMAIWHWNDAHYFAAIRDNRAMSDKITLNQWEAVDSKHSNLRIKGNGVVPEYCVFVTNGVMNPGFNDWLQAVYDDNDIEFRTRITVGKETTISVQLIGDLVSAQPEPSSISSRKIQGNSFKGLSASRESAGVSLEYTLPAGEHELRVVARPIEFHQDVVPGLNIAWVSGKKWPESIIWIDCSQTPRRKPSVFSMFTADGTELFTLDGHATKAAWDLGLVPLTGTDTQDRNTLAWIFSSAAEGKSLSLTLDASLQKMTLYHLEKRIDELWGQDKYSDRRRGAVVMLDADTGEILAAASYPRLKIEGHPWDLRSFATYFPTRSWRTFQPWQGVDGHNAPGSTFKPVVAMAAIEAMKSDIPNAGRIEHFLSGYSKSEFQKSGLTLDCAAYDPFKGKCYQSRNIPSSQLAIPNFRNQALGISFKEGDMTLGLKQAIRDSVNVWFLRLGWLMDGEKARAYDSAIEHLRVGQEKPKRPALHLAQMTQNLGFNGQPLDLLANINQQIHLTRSIPKGNKEGDVSFASTGILTLLNENESGLQRILTRNSFGQGMTATPLQMARVAAAVATGKLPYPFLVSGLDGNNLGKPKSGELTLDSNGLEMLRSGMKAVPETGTAAKAFNNHPDQICIYGKTGTANVADGNKSFWSTWFIGWREPIRKGERRIAFACFVTHATGAESSTGGSVAAPIIARIFEEANFEKKITTDNQ